MSDDDEDFEDEAEPVEFPAYPWSKTATVAAVMNYAAELQMAAANFFASLTIDAAADHNQHVDRRNMHQEISKEIETLPLFKESKE